MIARLWSFSKHRFKWSCDALTLAEIDPDVAASTLHRHAVQRKAARAAHVSWLKRDSSTTRHPAGPAEDGSDEDWLGRPGDRSSRAIAPV